MQNLPKGANIPANGQDTALGQRSAKREDVAWLAGLFDGEGCVCLSVAKKTGIIHPRMDVATGVNRETMEDAKSIAEVLTGRQLRFMTNGNVSQDYRPAYILRARNQGDIRMLCHALLPFVRGKAKQVKLMLAYLDIAPGKGNRFSEQHYSLVSEMRHLNRRFGKLEWRALQQETERVAPNVGEETVRTTVQAVEESDRKSTRLNSS